MAEESLSILVHGPAGSGKTTLGLTGPGPTLFLDVETASRFIPKKDKVSWDPMKDSPPVYDGSWKYCVVKVKTWDIANKTLEYLRSNKHPFKTVVLDSVSEILIKAKEKINGQNQFQIQHWGRLGQNMGQFLRSLRDITADDDSPIQIMYIISASKEFIVGEGDDLSHEWRPLLEGATKDTIGFLYDMVAFITLDTVPNDPDNPARGTRRSQTFYTGADPTITSKCRPPGVPDALQDLTLEQILYGVFPPEGEPEPESEVPVKEEPVKEETKPKKQASSSLPPLPTK